MGGQQGNRHTYCDEVIILIWNAKGPLGEEGPAQRCSGPQRRNVIFCPPVVNKIAYQGVQPESKFLYQKPMALYAELLQRYLPDEPCTVAELTGT